MRKVIYLIASSIDNYIADKNGSIDAFPREGPHVEDYIQNLIEMDTVIMGRKVYEFAFQYGLQAGESMYPHMRNYLYSNNVKYQSKDESLTIVRGDMEKHILQLKAEEGPDIFLLGGGQFAGSLLSANLIDEVHRRMCPILLGSGIHLFEDFEGPLPLKVFDKKEYNNGVILEKYRVISMP